MLSKTLQLSFVLFQIQIAINVPIMMQSAQIVMLIMFGVMMTTNVFMIAQIPMNPQIPLILGVIFAALLIQIVQNVQISLNNVQFVQLISRSLRQYSYQSFASQFVHRMNTSIQQQILASLALIIVRDVTTSQVSVFNVFHL
jgi:hypothetical protein